MSKLKFVVSRAIQMAVTLFLVLSVLFVIFRLMPGDITGLFLFQGASQEAVEAFRAKWHLNDPIHVQYWIYLQQLARFDMGTSLAHQEPVIDYVKLKIFNSAILIAPAITAAYIVGSIVGTVLGFLKNTKFEQYGIVVAVIVGTVPSFFLGLLAIIVFSEWLGLFPSGSMASTSTYAELGGEPWWALFLTSNFYWHYTLPFMTIVIRNSYRPTLLMRTNVVEISNQGFIDFYRYTGLPKWKRLLHLTRHASFPVITQYPLSLVAALGGLVLTETVFNWPGIGHALVLAVLQRDYPVVQFIFVIMAAFIIFANFFVDIFYSIIDPRVTLGDKDG